MSDRTATPTPPPLEALRRSLPARFKAAGIHLALSGVVFAVALYLILVHWYPGFHFGVDGGWRGVKIMAGVDLVLGPALTLVIFNPYKARRLIVIDLACIAIIQVAALVWGFYAVHSQRPVAVSFQEGAFRSMTPAPLAVEKRPADFAEQFSERRPPLVFARSPANAEEETRAAMQLMVGGVAPHEDPFFFDRLDRHWGEVRRQALSAESRAKESPAFAQALPGFVAGQGGSAADYLFFPYVGRDGGCTVAFRPDGELVGALGCERN